MKECKYCGTQYADHLTTCPSCGANVVVSEKDKIIEDAHNEQEIAMVKEQLETKKKMEKPKMAPGKKILITMLSMVAVLAIIIVATTVINNQPVTADGKTNSDLKDIYESAMDSMELGEFEEVMATLDSIPTEYKDYDKVVEQRDKALDAYREQVLAQVDSYVAVGKHNDALSALTATMEKYGENKELIQKKEEILYGYKQGIFAEAENYATTGDYSTAIKRLQMLLDVIGTDMDTELKVSYYEKAQVLKQVQIYEDEKNYVAAIEYLEKKLDELDDTDFATKLTSLYSTYKASCIETAKAYIAEKNYANAVNVLEDLSEVIGNDDEVVMLISDNKKALTLEKAQAYINSESYLVGIDYLKLQIRVLGEDSALTAKLEEMISMYKTIVLQEAEKSAKSGQYSSAVFSLNSFIYDVGKDAEVSSKILEYRKKEINVKLAEFDKNKDDAGAILYLQNEVFEINADAELKGKLDTYISRYRQDLFAKAATQYEESGYSAAVKLLSNDKVLKNDAEVKAKIAHYNNKKPVLLSSLKPYQRNLGYESKTIVDILGNSYQGYFYTDSFYSGVKDSNRAVYFLNGEYEVFRCKLILINANGSHMREITVKDNDTGEVLFSKSLNVKNVDGMYIEINVTQVKFLEIELVGCAEHIAVMVDAQLIKK